MDRTRRFPDEPLNPKKPVNFTTDSRGHIIMFHRFDPEKLPTLTPQSLTAKELPAELRKKSRTSK